MHKTVISSTLKTCDDIRSYHKIGKSILQYYKTELHIIGNGIQEKKELDNTYFYDLAITKRLSLKRIFSPIKILFLYFKIKPNLIICSTHEHISASLVYKCVYKCNLIYDVRENYCLNISCQNLYPPLIKNSLKLTIKVKELLAKYYFDAFILAEAIYKDQMSFKPSYILENKFIALNPQLKPYKEKKTIVFCITGTLSKEYGFYENLELFKRINQQNHNCKLVIAGYSTDKQIVKTVNCLLFEFPNIEAHGIETYCSQLLIEKVIANADYLIAIYPIRKSFNSKLPTKFYEALFLSTNVITSVNFLICRDLHMFTFVSSLESGVDTFVTDKSFCNLSLTPIKYHWNEQMPIFHELFMRFLERK